MTKEKEIVSVEENDTQKVKAAEETLAAFEENEAPAVDAQKKRKSNASIAVDKFDWDEFEKDVDYDQDKSTIAENYNQTLSKVIENEVVEGVVIDRKSVV